MASTAISAQGSKLYIAGTPGTAITITAITKANPAVVTATNTTAVGDVVQFGAVTGMPEIFNRVGIVTVASGTSFTVNIDASNFGSAGTTGTASPQTWTQIANIETFSGFDGSKSEVDVSNLASAAKEFIPGLEDFGQFTFGLQVDNTDAGQLALRVNKSSNSNTNFKLLYPNLKLRAFTGFVKKFSDAGGVDQTIKGSVDVRITGPVAFG